MMNAMIEYARQSLIDAVYYYDKDKDTSNLTGNTISAFSAGVYVDGRLAYPVINILDVLGIDSPTSGYTKPGDKGFSDYDSGEYIGSEDDPAVREYGGEHLRFRPADAGGNAIDDTRKWLEEQHPRRSHITVIVANCSPYVNFLHNMRDFEILDTISKDAKIRKEMTYQLVKNKLREGYRGITSSGQNTNNFSTGVGNI